MKNKIFKSIVGTLSITALSMALYSCSNSITIDSNGSLLSDTGNISTKTWYVSPSGTYSAEGTKDNPISFSGACSNASAGDTILLEAGTYKNSTRIRILTSGAPNYPITVKPENDGDSVIFDFSEMEFDGNNRGIQLDGDYWHFYGIDITGAGDNGMYIGGSYNTIENCQFYNNRDTGLQLGRSYGDYTAIDQWPSYNLIKNCTSFANYDAETFGENADGFGAKLTIGYGNIFDGCIAFRNSDDGWDLYAKEDSGNIGTVILYNCVSFENGFLPYTIDRTNSSTGETYKSYNTMNGDGIGFKLGGSTMEGDVIIENCIAFNNKLHGFSDNSNPGVISIKNSSAINNCIGLNSDGTVSSTRGIEDSSNKSNNFDLARSTASYNNYYGLLSYINNQAGFTATGESSYNEDAYKGSVAYSIFNTGYSDGKEIYTAFTSYEDASSYSSDSTDSAFSYGTTYTGTLNDSCFASIASINALCSSVDDISSLKSIATTYRNSDGSVNLGDVWRITDTTLLTYANGSSIGHSLNKSSYDEYNHYDTSYFSGCKTRDDVKVMSCYNVLEVAADVDAIYQDFEIPKRIHGCEIEWTSSNTDVISINTSEEISASNSVYITGEVLSPTTSTEVTLTATITCGSSTMRKTFELTVLPRNMSLGEVLISGSSSIKVKKYGTYLVPTVSIIDSSSNTSSELNEKYYSLSYKYEYASDKNSRFYKVDNVYTSVAGVYRITITATSNITADNGKTATATYYVYILDPDCDIDFMNESSSFAFTNTGFTISGELSNIMGYVYTLVSTTELSISALDLIANENAQEYTIESDTITAEFEADNNTTTGYYVYYVVTNQNKSKTSDVYNVTVDVKTITEKDEFYTLATQAKYAGTTISNTTIYSLSNDLDFTDYEWKSATGAAFKGLFNGNGHTISNITISLTSEKGTNIFYKVQGGTVMNAVFKNISITNKSSTGKQVGIIGELQGGYIANISAINVSASGYQGVGGIIGAVTGGKNYVMYCTLDNSDYEEAIIAASGKYAGGIIGNGQKNSDQSEFELHILNCATYATIGDGKDSGGNTGGIIGRVKNESTIYITDIEYCVFVGTIISKGQYNAGICGDFDNGLGYVKITNCFSNVIFIYDGETFDATDTTKYTSDEMTYAQKNSNPIVGRAVSAASGTYETSDNYGSFTEYYSTYIMSRSFIETYPSGISESIFKNGIGFDLDSTWTYIEEDKVIYLNVYLNHIKTNATE